MTRSLANALLFIQSTTSSQSSPVKMNAYEDYSDASDFDGIYTPPASDDEDDGVDTSPISDDEDAVDTPPASDDKDDEDDGNYNNYNPNCRPQKYFFIYRAIRQRDEQALRAMLRADIAALRAHFRLSASLTELRAHLSNPLRDLPSLSDLPRLWPTLVIDIWLGKILESDVLGWFPTLAFGWPPVVTWSVAFVASLACAVDHYGPEPSKDRFAVGLFALSLGLAMAGSVSRLFSAGIGLGGVGTSELWVVADVLCVCSIYRLRLTSSALRGSSTII
ncbi:hypothetical protein IWZ00DRAFT_12858 [Phyllosticta capitalensis]